LSKGYQFEAAILDVLPKVSNVVAYKILSRTNGSKTSDIISDDILQLDVKSNWQQDKFTDVKYIFPSVSEASRSRSFTIWIPKFQTFPAVDAILTLGSKLYFLSITIGHSHTVVIKCLKGKDPAKGARINRRAHLEYDGLIPMVNILKKNGFDINIADIPFIWCVPAELIDYWRLNPTKASPIQKGIELLSKAELQIYRKMCISHFVLINPNISLSALPS
jgi:hypothetical protein